MESESPIGVDGTGRAFGSRRRRLVQDDLARIAVRLFLERGFDAVSVEEIASAAGMSERTFFRYFATKDEALRRYRSSLTDDLLAAFVARPETESPVAALRAAYAQTSSVRPTDRARVLAVTRLLARIPAASARDVGESIVEPGLVAELARRMGVDATDLRPRALTAAAQAAAHIGMTAWSEAGGRADPRRSVLQAIDSLGLVGT